MTFLPIPGKDYQDSYNRCTCNDTRSPTCIMFGSWKATNTTCTAWKPTQTSFSTDSLLLYIPRWRITRRHAATLSSWILLFAPVCIEMNANHVLVSSFLPSFLIFLFLSFGFLSFFFFNFRHPRVKYSLCKFANLDYLNCEA